jgi:hypothetical protein
MMGNVKVVISVLVLLNVSLAYAQEGPSQAQPMANAVQRGQGSWDLAKWDSEEKYCLSGYWAVANDLPSLAVSSFSKEKVADLLDWRYLGEGKCDQDTKDFTRDICWAVQNMDCAPLSERVRKETCQAILSGDPAAAKAVYDASREGWPETLKGEIVIALGIARGYREQGAAACQRYLDAYPEEIDIVKRFFICELIFSSEPDKEYKRVETDLAYWVLAKDNPDECKNIVNPELKKACLSPVAVSP